MEATEAGFSENRKGNPIVFYLRSLLYMFTALFIRVVALTPLAALFVFETGSPLRWLALLCPVLILFLVLPLRFSFAEAMVGEPGVRVFSFDRALSLSAYGEKLGESLMHLLHVLKWSLPLIALSAAVGYYYYNVDLITLMQSLSNLGAGVTAIRYAVANFFIGIFGGEQLVSNAGVMEGFYTVAAVLGVGVLILLWGVVRNSAFRYIWVLADRVEKSPRAEARRRLYDRRWAQLGVAAINLILWIPALYVTFTTLKTVLGDVSDALLAYISTQQLNIPEWTSAIGPLLFAFLVCYMPLLPVRRALTCRYAMRPARRTVTTRQVNKAMEAGYVVSASGAPQPGAEPYALPMNEVEAAPTAEPAPAYRPATVPVITPAQAQPVPETQAEKPAEGTDA